MLSPKEETLMNKSFAYILFIIIYYTSSTCADVGTICNQAKIQKKPQLPKNVCSSIGEPERCQRGGG